MIIYLLTFILQTQMDFLPFFQKVDKVTKLMKKINKINIKNKIKKEIKNYKFRKNNQVHIM